MVFCHYDTEKAFEIMERQPEKIQRMKILKKETIITFMLIK